MDALIEELKANNFRLGGSRRMAEKYPAHITVSEATDYDFYCANTVANREWITARGFVKVEANNRAYWDSLLVDIYKHEQHAIEILIRSDVNLYTRAFESIAPGEYIDHLWKSAPYRKDEPKQLMRQRVCGYFNNLFARHNHHNEDQFTF